MAVFLILAVLLVITVAGGITVYRRTLARGPYNGTSAGALRLASILGAFLGVSVALVTVLVVLVIRALH
jgi:hypothetical protein